MHDLEETLMQERLNDDLYLRVIVSREIVLRLVVWVKVLAVERVITVKVRGIPRPQADRQRRWSRNVNAPYMWKNVNGVNDEHHRLSNKTYRIPQTREHPHIPFRLAQRGHL
jgi:hypothetical protein